MLAWTDDIAYIHGLTARERKALQNLGVTTVGGLLSVFPRRYDDYSCLVAIKNIPLGIPVTIRAKVVEMKQAPTFRRGFAIIKGIVEDETANEAVPFSFSSSH